MLGLKAKNLFPSVIATRLQTAESVLPKKKIHYSPYVRPSLALPTINAKRAYACEGVPSAFDTTASIWTKASLGKANTPIVLRAGTPPGKNAV